MPKISRQNLLDKVSQELIHEVLSAFNGTVELKSDWEKKHGEKISAIANQDSREGGWLIIGINDQGKLLGKDINWLKDLEHKVSSHLAEFLKPNYEAVSVSGEQINGSHILLIEISSPDEVVYWDQKAFNLIGTTKHEMGFDEILSLELKLPGHDFSKLDYNDEVNSSLVLDFSQKLHEVNADWGLDPSNTTANEILRKLGILKRNAAGILFGDFNVRIVHYDINGDVLDQKENKGLYNILNDKFIEEIQSWTRKQGTSLKTVSIAAKEETPYPLEALREILANAVAHSFYSKNRGDIVVEMFPNKICISNNCTLEAKMFVNKWFSGVNNSQNKVLMSILRMAKLTDELGSGKNRIFRYMIENGKREPLIDFAEFQSSGRWKITLYNEESNTALLTLIERLKSHFKNPDQWRIATALVLWAKKPWSQILHNLDEHFKKVAESVLENKNRPINKWQDKIILKRWVRAIFEGQVTISFTTVEEDFYLNLFKDLTAHPSYKGLITNSQAREIIGLTDTTSEAAQLSNLFRKWGKLGYVEKTSKRGEWKFLESIPTTSLS